MLCSTCQPLGWSETCPIAHAPSRAFMHAMKNRRMASSVAGRRKRRKKNPRIRAGKLGSLRTMKERITRFIISVWRGRRGLPHPTCPTRRGGVEQARKAGASGEEIYHNGGRRDGYRVGGGYDRVGWAQQPSRPGTGLWRRK